MKEVMDNRGRSKSRQSGNGSRGKAQSSGARRRTGTQSAPQGKKRSNNVSRSGGSANRKRTQSGTRRSQSAQNGYKKTSGSRKSSSKKAAYSNSRRSANSRTTQYRTNVGKKKRYSHKSNMIYYTVIVAVVLIIGAFVGFGFIFKVDSISVSGDTSKYSTDQIITASEIKKGDTLISVGTNKSEEKIETALAYIENAEVKKKFPSAVSISVTEAKPMAVVETEQLKYVISDTYKIIDVLNGDVPKELILIKGLSVKNGTVGYKIEFNEKGLSENLNRLIENLNTEELPVRAVEVSKSGYFKVNYDERIIIDFGTLINIKHKIRMAKYSVEKEIAKTDKGILYVYQENQTSFRLDTGNLRLDYKINPESLGKNSPNRQKMWYKS